jgi:hypothetical protein
MALHERVQRGGVVVDKLTEFLLKNAAESLADNAVSKKDDPDPLPFMENFPAGSKVLIKGIVSIYAGPVFLMQKIGRRLLGR